MSKGGYTPGGGESVFETRNEGGSNHDKTAPCAADCALVDAEETIGQEESWDEGTQVWTTYYSFIAQPNTDFDGDVVLDPTVPDDYLLSD